MKLPYDLATPRLGIYPENIIIKKDTCTPVLTGALFTIARTWKQSRCSLPHEWMKLLWCYVDWDITRGIFCVVLILSGSQPVTSQFL